MADPFTITGGGEQVAYWRNPDGSEEQIQPNLYVVPPPAGSLLRLKVKRFAKLFEMAKAQEYGGGMQTMTRIECEITDGPMKGRQINPMISWAVGEQAKFGQIIKACRGTYVGKGEEFNPYSIAGMEFQAMVKGAGDDGTGKPRYSVIVNGTIGPVDSNGHDDTWSVP